MTSYPLIKSGATKAIGSGSSSLSWSWIRGGWTEDPNTSAGWTISAIEAMEIGARAAAANARVARQSAYSCYVWCAPAYGGSQAIWFWFERARRFYDDLRKGLIPLGDLERRYREVMI